MVLAPGRQQGIDVLHLVDNRLYTDPRAFELERERIFERVWNFYCHESEVARPGEYLTRDVAGNPLVVVRNARGELRAYYNTCRHRGALVLDQERGRCATIRCRYHWWTYSLDGDLLSVPGPEAYGPEWCKDDFGLVPVRVESAYGLIFVCLDPDAPALADYLGPEALEWLGKALSGGEFEVFHRHDLPVKANWKGWAENARDGYHVPCVHPFFLKHSPPREYRLLANGHAVQRLGMKFEGMDPDFAAKLQACPLPGAEYAGDGFILMLFPDVGITLRSNVVSILSQVPLGPEETIMEDRVLGLRGDSEEQRALRLLNWQTWFNNPVEQEDHPIFEIQQRGLHGKGVRYSFIGRGADSAAGTRGDDNRLRQFWARWRECMGVETNSLEVRR